ncbi:MAG: HDOD domain-containing protein [Spirochaetales bacterium]|nr:HDOD domain-containing protein [Leptospiraceae bacterium]MCP5481436.1 HDOD domain-containing protein [Spirochaetales bacterium]
MKDFSNLVIPPLPAVSAEIMRFDPLGENASSQGLEQIVAPDEGVCADLLRIANSSFYGRSGRIRTLKDAITLLGLKTVKNLVVLSATKTINSALRGPTYRRYLHEFTVASALVAEEMCLELGLKARKEEAFLGALLHKIGMTIMGLTYGKAYAELIRKAEETGELLTDLERGSLGTDHIEIGKCVFETWRIPQPLQEVIAGHNFIPDAIQDVPELVRITALASLTTREMMGLLLPMEDLDRRARIAASYNAAGLIAKYDERKFEAIKAHPFYQQVAA